MEFEGNILRHELKYYINLSVYYSLRERFRFILKKDSNMNDDEGYLISSLYFDDIYKSAEREKVSGIKIRKKFRIRCYDRSDTFIRLECKKKFGEYIAKTSSKICREEYDNILNENMDFMLQREDTLSREWYGYYKTKLLRPKVVVEYQREAYIAEQGNVRITFDKDISVNTGTGDIFDEKFATSKILPDGVLVLEVKYDDFLPSYIQQILQTAMTEKCAISKYVMCVQKNNSLKIGE